MATSERMTDGLPEGVREATIVYTGPDGRVTDREHATGGEITEELADGSTLSMTLVISPRGA